MISIIKQKYIIFLWFKCCIAVCIMREEYKNKLSAPSNYLLYLLYQSWLKIYTLFTELYNIFILKCTFIKQTNKKSIILFHWFYLKLNIISFNNNVVFLFYCFLLLFLNNSIRVRKKKKKKKKWIYFLFTRVLLKWIPISNEMRLPSSY
jgi:hypothetical protein